MSSPVFGLTLGYKSKEIALPAHLSENARVIFSKIVMITEPRLPLGMVYYSLDGVSQDLALRIDYGKQVFLDHLTDPQLDHQISSAAHNVVTYLGNLAV